MSPATPLKRPLSSGSAGDGGDRPTAEPTKKQKLGSQKIVPRRHQKEVLDVALQRNTIALLDAGSGKTMIAVMLIRKTAKELMDRGDGHRRLIVFLAPTVHLITEQFEAIKLYTELDAQVYYGAKGVDLWTAKEWEKEVAANQVMVMTPQILLDALRKDFLTWGLLHLLIFDECHCSTGNHPYSKIMKEFYHTSLCKPKIFGSSFIPEWKVVMDKEMSEIVSRQTWRFVSHPPNTDVVFHNGYVPIGLSSVMICENQLSKLEILLDSKIYTVAERTELNLFVSEVKEVTIYYDAKLSIHEDLKTKLRSIWNKFDGSVATLRESPFCQWRDADDILKLTRKQSSSFHTMILHCLDDLGLICGNEVAKIYMEAIRLACSTEGHDFPMKNMEFYICFLEEVSHAIEERLTNGYELLLQTERGCLEAVKLGYISPKLHELLKKIQSFAVSNQDLSLIFFDRIIKAKVLECFMKNVAYLSHLNVSYLTGGSLSTDALTQNKEIDILELFHSGNVNLLFSTDIAGERYHIPDCSCVIRFDLPKTVRSYVQSRGRARQAGSHYIIMLERGNIQQRDLLFGLILGNHMMDISSSRDPETIISGLFCDEDNDVYIVESTGAIITLDSSISLIHQYCEKLPKDEYSTPKPAYQFTSYDGLYQCKLTLPPRAAFQTLGGPLNQNSHVAKQLVCLDACKRLHQLGAISDYLLPCVKEPMEIVLDETIEKSGSGAGTTKRKELHGTTPVYALSGSWAHQNNGITLQGYKLKFSCDQIDQKYRGFLLLIDAVLDEDVASFEIDLYLIDKMVRASISPCGPTQLDKKQVEQGKMFQEFFFNGLFGKLFIRHGSCGIPREFIVNEGNNQLWSTSNMYMLLPLDIDEGDVKINWNGIHESASAVKFMRSSKLTGISSSLESSDHVPSSSSSITKTECCMLEVINLANKSVELDGLKDMVVLAIHTGKIYIVLDVVKGSSAESPFEGAAGKSLKKKSTYSDYFNETYNIVLQYPEQPLLLLKHSHNPHNLLSSKGSSEGGSSKRTRIVKKPQSPAHMPPELLFHVDISLDILKSFYLLPSLMYRMESLMLASQLRKEIAFNSGEVCISSARILEAITTLRCHEDFSLERLELLGDSVLKYAVSCYEFMKFPDKHEGQLSSGRSQAVCNATLHKLGTKCNIQGYIRDAPFDPRRWVAPGQKTSRPAPCNCRIDSSEAPINIIYDFEDSSIVIGKSCDKGHRWICSKTISDCVESLIGAYHVDGGLKASFAVMKWLGIDVEFEPALIEEAVKAASIQSYLPNLDDIKMLESKLDYEFLDKSLLLKATIHASHEELGSFYCYQNLEFLGDAALDLLITSYLFRHYKEMDPGELTDLRSASVNNENFAQVAVRNKFQQHLRHSSGLLLEQITEYVKILDKSNEDPDFRLSNGTSKCPKVLGDIVESIAGAVLIDTKLNLDKLWEVFEPILSPIVTPETLDLPIMRQLTELCSHWGYFLNPKFTTEGDKVVAVLDIQLEDMLLVGRASETSKKAAKLKAASLLLEDLKNYLSHSQYASRRRRCEEKSIDGESVKDAGDGTMSMIISKLPGEKEIVECHNSSNMKSDVPVVLFDKTQKGKPRMELYELCKKLRWPPPIFEMEEKPRSKKSQICFVSKITMCSPDSTVITLTGEECPDKKRAQDSGSLAMLYELEKRGKCQLNATL